jgi:hypothetical protein
VVVGRGRELQLGEDAGYVGLDRLGRYEEAIADGLVGAALGHEREDLALAIGQLIERAAGTAPVDEQGHDLVFIAPLLTGALSVFGGVAVVFASLAWLHLAFEVLLVGASWTRVRLDEAGERATQLDAD